MPRIVELDQPTTTLANNGQLGEVTFIPDSGPQVTILSGETPPLLIGGYGAWEVSDRPKRKGITRFTGTDPLKQDISVIFNGFIDGMSQEIEISKLDRMARQPNTLVDPPKLRLVGHALRKDLVWVITGIDMDTDKTIWEVIGGNKVRTRQAATVHLLEFVDDVIIVTETSPAVKSNTGGKTKTISGLTMKQLAQIEYGDPNAYFEIIMANPWLDSDPRKIIPDGTPVFIPQYKGHHAHTVTIGKNT